jgi:hypothetical protein
MLRWELSERQAFSAVLRFDLGALLGKCCTTWAMPPSKDRLFIQGKEKGSYARRVGKCELVGI